MSRNIHEIIKALEAKTVARGATPEEAAAAQAKAQEFRLKLQKKQKMTWEQWYEGNGDEKWWQENVKNSKQWWEDERDKWWENGVHYPP